MKLLVLPPQVDAQSQDGLTALGFAAAAGHLDIVTMLSQNAAKVDPCKGHKDCQNNPPPTLSYQYFCQTFFIPVFLCISSKERVSVCVFVLKRILYALLQLYIVRVRVHSLGFGLSTFPVIFCSQVGHVDNSGRCVLVHAAQRGHIEVLCHLLRNADWSCTSCCSQKVASKDQAVQQALTAAASMGHSEVSTHAHTLIFRTMCEVRNNIYVFVIFLCSQMVSYLLDLSGKDDKDEESPEINTPDSLWGETGTVKKNPSAKYYGMFLLLLIHYSL